MIWIERRVYGSAGTLSLSSYRRISRLTVGGCSGVVLATAFLFHIQLLVLPHVANTTVWIMSSFFGSWTLAIGWSLLRSNEYQTTRELLAVTGGLAVLVPFVNGAVTGSHILNAFARGHWVTAGTDVTLLLIGVALLYVAARLPSERPLRKGKYGRAAERGREPLPDSTLKEAEAS